MTRTLVAFAVALAASSLQAQPLAHEVVRDAAERITYLATEDGAVAFNYSLRSPFFSHVWTHRTGWLAMPETGEDIATTLSNLSQVDSPTARQLQAILHKPATAKCELMTNEKADCNTGPPDITVDVVATAPTRAWSGTIGGVNGVPLSTGGPVSTSGGYPFHNVNERFAVLLQQKACSTACDRTWSAVSAGCAFAAVAAKSPYVGLACSAGAYASLQACKGNC